VNRYSSAAIILRKRDYSEADKIIVAFSRKQGKVSFIAKGIKKINSKKRGSIETGNIVLISATRSEGLGILTEAKLLRSFHKVRTSLNKISLLHYFCEVVDKLTQPEEPDPALFNLLAKYIGMLEETSKLKRLREHFILNTLTLLGFWPKGKKMIDPDAALEEVLERRINSARVGKKLAS